MRPANFCVRQLYIQLRLFWSNSFRLLYFIKNRRRVSYQQPSHYLTSKGKGIKRTFLLMTTYCWNSYFKHNLFYFVFIVCFLHRISAVCHPIYVTASPPQALQYNRRNYLERKFLREPKEINFTNNDKVSNSDRVGYVK